MVPIGGVETLNLSGSALARATNSFIVLTPKSGITAKTCGETASSHTATKSLNGS